MSQTAEREADMRDRGEREEGGGGGGAREREHYNLLSIIHCI